MEKQLIDFIRFRAAGNPGVSLFGLMGGAGAGKTHLAAALQQEGYSPEKGYEITVYHVDWRFIEDSAGRLRLLRQKQAVSIDALRDACNQFNWWDWQAVERDLTDIRAGKPITLESAYLRETGTRDMRVFNPSKIVIVDGAILGPPPVLRHMKDVFWLCTPDAERLKSLLDKDANRRSATDTAARFLITQYAESLYVDQLLTWGITRIPVNRDGTWGAPFNPCPIRHYLPVMLE